MVMGSNTDIFHLFLIKLAGRRIAVKIFHQELKFSTECLNIIELKPGSGGYIGIPIDLLMVLDIDREYRS